MLLAMYLIYGAAGRGVWRHFLELEEEQQETLDSDKIRLNCRLP